MSSHGFQPMVKMLNNNSFPPRNLFGIQSHMREDGIRITRCLLRSHGFQPMVKRFKNDSLPPRTIVWNSDLDAGGWNREYCIRYDCIPCK